MGHLFLRVVWSSLRALGLPSIQPHESPLQGSVDEHISLFQLVENGLGVGVLAEFVADVPHQDIVHASAGALRVGEEVDRRRLPFQRVRWRFTGQPGVVRRHQMPKGVQLWAKEQRKVGESVAIGGIVEEINQASVGREVSPRHGGRD
jgi:hypothetical protein